MSRSPTTFAEIFSHWSFAGGYVLLAKNMRVPQSRARMWLKRGYLEPYYWPKLIKVLQRRFSVVVTLDDLIAASAARAQARIKASRRSASKCPPPGMATTTPLDAEITYDVMVARLNEAFGTGFTRGALAGRLRRLKDRERPVAALPVITVDKPKAKPPAPISEPPQSTPVTLLDREPWQCRWPVNDGGPFLFCGAAKGDYDPTYCQHHRRMATGRAVRRGEMVVGQ